VFHRLNIPQSLYEGMLEHALAERPLECCGLLAGVIRDGVGEVERRYPLVNAAASPVEFESDPRSMFAAVRNIDRHGLEVLAIYHSHPTSEPVPSRTDLARNWWGPNVVNLIIGLTRTPPLVRGWWLGAEDYCQAEWQIGGGAES
jgi:proteasome lid subunit RPN8/RPN11